MYLRLRKIIRYQIIKRGEMGENNRNGGKTASVSG